MEYASLDHSHLDSILKIENESNPFPWTERNFRDCLDKGYYSLALELDKRLAVEREKIGSKDSLTVNQLASTYLDEYDGDLNKATNKAKFFLEVRPQLAGTVGETQIGGIIEADLSNEKQAKTFARANRNKVGKVFWDINTGTLKKLVKDPETNALGFVDFSMTGDMQPDTEGETLETTERKIESPGLYGQETKPPKKLKEILPDLRDTGFDEDFYQM